MTKSASSRQGVVVPDDDSAGLAALDTDLHFTVLGDDADEADDSDAETWNDLMQTLGASGIEEDDDEEECIASLWRDLTSFQRAWTLLSDWVTPQTRAHLSRLEAQQVLTVEAEHRLRATSDGVQSRRDSIEAMIALHAKWVRGALDHLGFSHLSALSCAGASQLIVTFDLTRAFPLHMPPSSWRVLVFVIAHSVALAVAGRAPTAAVQNETVESAASSAGPSSPAAIKDDESVWHVSDITRDELAHLTKLCFHDEPLPASVSAPARNLDPGKQEQHINAQGSRRAAAPSNHPLRARMLRKARENKQASGRNGE